MGAVIKNWTKNETVKPLSSQVMSCQIQNLKKAIGKIPELCNSNCVHSTTMKWDPKMIPECRAIIENNELLGSTALASARYSFDNTSSPQTRLSALTEMA